MNEDLTIAMAWAVLFSSVKNPKRKATLKRAVLKFVRMALATYAGDPDFAYDKLTQP